MSLNPVSNNYGWNYSKPDKEGYSTSITGTVVSIQEVQKRKYTRDGRPGVPEFWDDSGKPVMNIRLGLAMPDGSLKAFVFQPAGKEAKAGLKKSIHMDLFALTGNTNMSNLIGKTITIWTTDGNYGAGNPRPWYCKLEENVGPFMLTSSLPHEFTVPELLCDDAVSGGQYQQQSTGVAPQNIQQPVIQQPIYQQPVYQQPVVQQPVVQQQTFLPSQQFEQQAYATQVQQQVPVEAPTSAVSNVPLPTQLTLVDGMDPAVMAAMSTLDATNIQPVNPMSEYDANIPF